MKNVLNVLILMLIIASCSSDDEDGREPSPIDPEFNITEGIMSSEGDSIEIYSASEQTLLAVRDTIGQPRELLGNDNSQVYVSNGVRRLIIDMGWYTITQFWSTKTSSYPKLMIKVLPNHTDAVRKVPVTIFSRRNERSSVGIFTETNFVQSQGNVD